MSNKIIPFTRFIARSRPSGLTRPFSTSLRASTIVDSNFISRITAAEKTITNSDEPAKGGPTARAQAHVGKTLNADVIHDITMGERHITGKDGPIQNGPTSIAQSALTGSGSNGSGNQAAQSNSSSNQASQSSASGQHNGRLDSDTIGKITEKEKQITGKDGPVQDGPTAQAQKHAGEKITSEALHDITEGEKKIMGGERIKGGPTSAAQSELGKSRS